MTTFEIPEDVLPNLDGYNSPEDMAAIRADLKELSAGVLLLASYAEAKESAMRCRLAGNIKDAVIFESAADSVYAKLPTWAKW